MGYRKRTMVIGHKAIHDLNHSFFIVSQAVLPAIAISVKHNCDKSCAARFVAERRNDGSRADLSPGMVLGKARVAERRLNELADAGFNRRSATNRIVFVGSTG